MLMRRLHWTVIAAAADDDACIVYRTHSLVLIDKSGHCEYIEQTMSCDAINAICTNLSASADKNTPIAGKRPSDWKTTHHQFSFA